ncbi:MAG: hypothetical protein RL499_151, partial [Actinomycetota bacterium]
SLTDPDYYPRGVLGWVYRRQAQFRVPAEQTLADQLSALGFDPSDITHVVLSHLHQDHAGNLAPFTEVPVFVAPAELALLSEKTPELHGVLARSVPPAGVDLVAVPFGDDERFDLFGDGSLVMLPTPGHTPGSMSLMISPTDAAPLLLVGDVTYDPALLARGIVPDVGDRAAQLATARVIADLAVERPGLRVVAAHDPGALATLRAHSPR